MGNRFLKWAGALSAVALVSGILAVSASAHIGVSHSPFDTEAPDLVSAEIGGDGVIYCFDEEVQTILDPNGFWLTGYDSDTDVTSDDADLADDENCVEAEFSDRAEEDYTIAGVDDDSVEDQNDDSNIEASAALEGYTGDDGEGDSEAPELIDFNVDEGDDEITYIFDEDVEDDCGTGGDYGYYTDDGEGSETFGTAVDCDANEVTVTFGNVDNVSRVFVDMDEAGSQPCTETPSGWCADVQGIGDGTDDADLEDIERTDDDEWTFIFDEDVNDGGSEEAWLITEDGNYWSADDCETSDNELECVFSALEDAEDFEVVGGAVDDGAVITDDADADDNTVGSVAIGSGANESGSSDAPDLEACELDPENELATFFFDEHIDEDTVDATDFQVFDDTGSFDDGNDVDDVEEEAGVAVIEFDEDSLEDAVGCFVDEDNVYDFLNNGENGNPSAAVGLEAAQSPSTATTSTTTATNTVTTGTQPTPQVRRIATSLTIRYDRDDRAFKGAVGSSRKRCQTGRLVQLHRKGKGVKGSDTSNRKGNWRVNKRARRGRWFADVARKQFTARNGDTIICRPDESVTIKVGRRRR